MGSAQTRPSRIIKVQQSTSESLASRWDSLNSKEDLDTKEGNLSTKKAIENQTKNNTHNNIEAKDSTDKMNQDTNKIGVKDEKDNENAPTEKTNGKQADEKQGEQEQTKTKEDAGSDDDDDDADGGDGEKNKPKKSTMKELTPEEIEELKSKDIDRFKELIKAAKEKESFQEEDGEYTSEVKAALMKMYRLYFTLSNVKKVSLAEIKQWRDQLAAISIETGFYAIQCEILIKTYPARWLKEDGHINYLLKFTVLVILNFCDASTDFAVHVANYPGLCEKLREILEDSLEEHINEKQTVSKGKMTQWAISIIHNLSMAESNMGRLREANFIEILLSYLATPKDMHRLNVFATLAGIINEKESEFIKANIELVSFLLKVLSKGLSMRLRRYNGWSCKECTLTVRMLARNDANKKLLVEQGALPLLVKFAQIGHPDEQYEAVSALWALSFDEDNRKKICCDAELGVVDVLNDLKSSEDGRIKKVCNGALWTLRDDLKTSTIEKYKSLAQDTSTVRARAKSAKKTAGHVMISYQWADQKTLMVVRDRLKASGVQVWMDIDQMGGSTLESMAQAVEQAKIILMCMSPKYKNSPNCRAEAEYAFQRHKAIVPLKMEQGYVPDGWLGFICGAKLFFDFSGKYSFDAKMDQLLKEILTTFKRQDGGSVTDEPIKSTTVTPVMAPPRDSVDSRSTIVPVAAPTCAPVAMTTLKKVRAWTGTEVLDWINRNDLKSCGIQSMSGGEVAMLMMMHQQAPEAFFNCLQNTLKIKDFKSMSKLAWALCDLAEETFYCTHKRGLPVSPLSPRLYFGSASDSNSEKGQDT